MRKFFITFGSPQFVDTRNRLCKEARDTGEFDVVKGFGVEDLTDQLTSSAVYSSGIKGGYWSWKPDVIYSAMREMNEGDVLFYVDAGSSVVPGREWQSYFKKLLRYQIIAQRIYLSTGEWTRRYLVDAFSKDGGRCWRACRQFTSNVVALRKTPFTTEFISAWRGGMIEHPEWVMDVRQEDLKAEYQEFKENRYDQSLYSALVYQYLKDPSTRDNVLPIWEHVEDIDPIRSQVIRITRLRRNEILTRKRVFKLYVRRVLKDWVRKPVFYLLQERIRLSRFIGIE